LTQNAAGPASARAETRPNPPAGNPSAEPAPPAAQAAEAAAVKGGAFIAPRPADAGPARPVPIVPSAASPVAAPAREAAPRRGRVPSLIERVTGVGRARPTPPPAAPRPAPPPVQQQPRLAPLDPDERPTGSKEDDLLDIPAFLRRQAN
jgi:cell division protein FtsZ